MSSPHILGGMSPEAGLLSLLTLFFHSTVCKLFRRLPNISELLGYLLQYKHCAISKCWLQTCLILSTEGHEWLNYATVLLDYSYVERHWGKSGETMTSSNQRLLKSNLHVSQFRSLTLKPGELLNLDSVHHMKQANDKQCRLLENCLSKHTENGIKDYCGHSHFQSTFVQTHSHSSQ